MYTRKTLPQISYNGICYNVPLLVKAGDVYTLTSDSTYTYVNNVLTSINGVDVTFGQATIPAVPELTA